MAQRSRIWRLPATGWGLRAGVRPLLAVLFTLSAVAPGYSQVPGPPPSGTGGPVFTACNGDVLTCLTSSSGPLFEPSSAVLTIGFTAATPLCSSVQVAVSVDGTLVGTSGVLAPGESMIPLTALVTAGTHFVYFSPTFQAAGCPSVVNFAYGSYSISSQFVAAPVPALSTWSLLRLAVLLAVSPALIMTKALRPGTWLETWTSIRRTPPQDAR
jgi:hypothetical protein